MDIYCHKETDGERQSSHVLIPSCKHVKNATGNVIPPINKFLLRRKNPGLKKKIKKKKKSVSLLRRPSLRQVFPRCSAAYGDLCFWQESRLPSSKSSKRVGVCIATAQIITELLIFFSYWTKHNSAFGLLLIIFQHAFKSRVVGNLLHKGL